MLMFSPLLFMLGHGLLGGVLCRPGRPGVGLTAVDADVVVTVPPQERLPGSLPSLGVWLEG